MAEDKKTLVTEVASKQGNGTMATPTKIGAAFTEIVDITAGNGTPATNYTLKQFFDNYLDFMNTGNFIDYGNMEPSNERIKIWIDTGHTNQDDLA